MRHCREQADKEIDMSDYTIQAGMHIDIDFTYGNTVGTVADGAIASGANIVTKGAGEQIRIVGKNGTFLFNEKIGGEYAGSGCHNAGDCHEFVITTMATGNTADTAGIIKNKDANDIYNVVGSLYSYRKQTDGKIVQRGFVVTNTTSILLMISMSDADYFVCASNKSSSGYDGAMYQYYNPTATSFSTRMRYGAGGQYNYWEATATNIVEWIAIGN